ncbi:MAG: SDR family oxidoreductase [Actinomycetota bacterium]|nr:SDR family oxidoreductase [Actinomycetota bacterium]
MLGSALAAAVVARRSSSVMTQKVDWAAGTAGTDLSAGLNRLIATAQSRPWRIAWCAGAGVTGTAAIDLQQEVAVLSGFLRELADRRAQLGTGTVFLASSAGGVFAGTPGGGPFTERHAPMPISDYGRAKLACEQAAARYGDESGSTILIGRISNLYGPGQNMAKAQGLISHLCRANISRQPISVFVSLDTIRDYLYVGDCASMIADMLDADPPAGYPAGGPLTKVLASQQGISIAALITVCQQVFKRAPLLILGSSAAAPYQVRDLRMGSVVWPQIDRRALTPLPAGIASTLAGTLKLVQSSR